MCFPFIRSTTDSYFSITEVWFLITSLDSYNSCYDTIRKDRDHRPLLSSSNSLFQ